LIELEYPAFLFKLNLKRFFNVPCFGCNAVCVCKLKKGDSDPCIANVSVDAVWEKVRLLLYQKNFLNQKY